MSEAQSEAAWDALQQALAKIDEAYEAVEGIDLYTGGFPVQFGNRMSGMVLMESLDSLKPRHTEVGLSVFNTSLLTAGNEPDRSWVFSARRGNLDLVIDPQFGSLEDFDDPLHLVLADDRCQHDDR